jgi:hypothetical protein
MQALPLAAFVPRRRNRPTELTTESLTEWVAIRRQGAHLGARTITGAGNLRWDLGAPTAAPQLYGMDSVLKSEGQSLSDGSEAAAAIHRSV